MRGPHVFSPSYLILPSRTTLIGHFPGVYISLSGYGLRGNWHLVGLDTFCETGLSCTAGGEHKVPRLVLVASWLRIWRPALGMTVGGGCLMITSLFQSLVFSFKHGQAGRPRYCPC